VSGPASYTVVVLAGGTARRMGGGDKTALDLRAGRSLLGHLVSGLERTVPVVVVGPKRALERPVQWTREDPPGGGPLAGLAAGLAAASESEWVVVLAGDQPFAAAAVPELLRACGSRADGADGAIGVDATGRDQPLLGAYRWTVLRGILDRAGPQVRGVSMRWLLDQLSVVRLPLPEAVLLDVDDPESLARARSMLGEQTEP
jgi:molybdopterin-guanine dinucleotide biosynthesis protein A